MERFNKNNLWKGLLAALGISGAAFLSYLILKKFKNRLGASSPYSNALTKEDSMKRAELISNIKYTLFLQLSGAHVEQSKNTYEGSILIDFDFKKTEDIFIDFSGKVLSITNNDTSIPFTHVNNKIYLSSKYLSNANRVNIVFSNKYSLESKGMRIFTDVNMVYIL
jgi:hypothetical protein